MDLPQFTGSGNGPEGIAGIPPEAFAALQAEGAAINPTKAEESPATTAVLNREADQLLTQMGLAQPAATQPPPPAETAQAPQTTPAPQPQTHGGPTHEDRIKAAVEKYKGDPYELAKATLNAQGLMTHTQQQRAWEIATLTQKVENLTNMLTQRQIQPPPWGAPPAQATPQPIGEEFWKDPLTPITNIVNQSVQQNMAAFAQAFATQQAQAREAEKFEQMTQSRAAEFNALKPVIDSIYSSNPSLYDSMDQRAAFTILLDQAKDRFSAMRADQFYADITGAPPTNGGGPGGQPAPQIGASLSNGGAQSRASTAQPGAQQNWSNTDAMKRLWRAPDGSVQEARTVTDILKERGFWENTPIY